MDASRSLFYRRCDRDISYEDFHCHQRYCPAGNPRRFKYACFDCHRVFKFVVRDDNQSRWQDPVCVRPCMSAARDAYRREHHIADSWEPPSTRRDITPTPAQIRHRERDHMHSLRSAGFANTAELDELTQRTPEAWWRPLVPRCPRCGNQGRQVSPTFEAPPQGDSRAWAALRPAADAADPRLCRCKSMGQERYADAFWKATRDGDAISEEKRRRVEMLLEASMLGVRTSEEEGKRSVIRALHRPQKQTITDHDEREQRWE